MYFHNFILEPVTFILVIMFVPSFVFIICVPYIDFSHFELDNVIISIYWLEHCYNKTAPVGCVFVHTTTIISLGLFFIQKYNFSVFDVFIVYYLPQGIVRSTLKKSSSF